MPAPSRSSRSPCSPTFPASWPRRALCRRLPLAGRSIRSTPTPGSSASRSPSRSTWPGGSPADGPPLRKRRASEPPPLLTMPLRGLRVLDLTRILAGPYATMILGDYGADIVKIEEPGKGDDTRAWGPPWVPGAAGASAYFTAVNRNKRSCTLDLKHPEASEALWRMIDRADVVISNFRAGVMARLGFDYEAVRARNPRVVYALINGYGETGPGSEKPSFDVIVQGESGVMDVTGFPDGPPTRVGISLGDETAGLLAVQGILAALLERARTGEGQRVEVALHDGLLALLTYHGQNWWAGGKVPARLGNAHPSIVPYQTFRASDGWINVGVGNERQWAALCRAVDREAWREDP